MYFFSTLKFKYVNMFNYVLLLRHQFGFQHSFVIGGDSNRSITNMVVSAMGVWLSLQNSAVLRLVHSLTHEILAEVNTAPAVTKMLSSKLPSLYYTQVL